MQYIARADSILDEVAAQRDTGAVLTQYPQADWIGSTFGAHVKPSRDPMLPVVAGCAHVVAPRGATPAMPMRRQYDLYFESMLHGIRSSRPWFPSGRGAQSRRFAVSARPDNLRKLAASHDRFQLACTAVRRHADFGT